MQPIRNPLPKTKYDKRKAKIPESLFAKKLIKVWKLYGNHAIDLC